MIVVQEKERFIHIGSEIDEQVAQDLASTLNMFMVKSTKKPICIMINSTGGSVADSLACYDALRLCPAPLTGIVMSNCLSAAVLVLMGCDKRVMSENSRLLIHDGTSNIARVHLPHLVAEAEEEKRISDLFDIILSDRSGQTLKQVKNLSNSCTYLNAEQSLMTGFATHILRPKVSRSRKRQAK